MATPPDSSAIPTETATARALAPDLARGVMLAFIAMANVAWHLWDQPSIGTSHHPSTGGMLDDVARFFLTTVVDGRSYPLFAFLFGYGMVQFAQARYARGVPKQRIRRMLRRRHWAMLLFGFLHATFLFAGDVLGAYGIAALLLVWILFERRDTTLMWVAGLLSGLMVVGSLLSLAAAVALDVLTPADTWDEIAQSYAASELGIMRDATAGQSHYALAMLMRGGFWLISVPSQALNPTILVAILLGWLAARHAVLVDVERHRTLLVRTALIGLPLAWVVGALTALQNIGVLPLHSALGWGWSPLNYTVGLAGGLGYAAVIALLADAVQRRTLMSARTMGGALLRAVAAVGQRSLSFYLWQSVVFMVLFNAPFLGLGQSVGMAAAVGIAFAVWAVGVIIAAWCGAHGKRGPAEVALRRLTYGPTADAAPASGSPEAIERIAPGT